MIKLDDTTVTLNFTGANIEGYATRLALSLMVHDHDLFTPEEAQRINTLLDNIEENFSEDDLSTTIGVLKNND